MDHGVEAGNEFDERDASPNPTPVLMRSCPTAADTRARAYMRTLSH